MNISPPKTNRFLLWSKIRLPIGLIKTPAVIIVLVGLIGGYQVSGTAVTLRVNEEQYVLHTHRLAVASILLEIGWALKPGDLIWPGVESTLKPGQTIEITLARPVVVDLGDILGDINHSQPHLIYTHQEIPFDIYGELGFKLAAEDDVYVDGRLWEHKRPLPFQLPLPSPWAVSLKTRLEALRSEPVQLFLNKSLPVHLVDGAQEKTFFSTQQTVGEVLVARNIPLYLGDIISPDLNTPLTSDMIITIERSVPVSIQVDGVSIKTRTRHTTISEVLAQEGVALIGQDHTIPAETVNIASNINIEVVRVVEALEIEKETTDYETIWIPDETLELDIQQIQQAGDQGVTKTRTRVRYENAKEVFRIEEDTWLEQVTTDKVIAYGTKVLVRTLQTPAGDIEYWRKIRMLATSYSAATSGKSKDHPAYGITRTGIQAGYGIVAVDPSVITLNTDLYVPDYGPAIAGDTGGAILGKHIDLGFDQDAPPLWYKWVDVYLLTPAPPWHEIRYVLPQWPQER